MKYSEIALRVCKESLSILIKYWWVFLGMSCLYHLYQYLIFRFFNIDLQHVDNVISTYNVLIYPVIVLVIMYMVDCNNKKQLPKDFNRIMSDAKRCYFRILLIYLAMELLRKNFGFGSSLVVFAVMYVKFPFVEQEIFFKDSSMWQAIKNTNEITNREDMIRAITILVFMFLVIYFLIQQMNYMILRSSIGHKPSIVLTIDLLRFSFYLFCKAVLTKVYTNIKHQ
jgi:hypothetical protein